ncbi:MAG: serine hydrolase [Patescibacteria group bacterium]
MKLSTKKFSLTVIVLSGAFVCAILIQVALSFLFLEKTGQAKIVGSSQVAQIIAESQFVNVVLEAKSAYVFDISTNKVLYAKNENEALPLASITKIMTALTARSTISENAIITLSNRDISSEGDSGLNVGERWRLGDLLDVALIVSSNDAAHAVANFVGRQGHSTEEGISEAAYFRNFIEMMNSKAQTMGLSTMKFYNETGLDIQENGLSSGSARMTPGAYGSAKDVSLLMTELWKTYPSQLEITARRDVRIVSQNGIAHALSNTNEALGHFPGMVGSKTGYTTLAGGNLAIIFDVGIGRPVVAVVLGSTYEGRFDDMQKLTDATLKTLQ